MLSCQQRRRYLFFEDKEVRYLYLRLQAFPLEWHRFFWEQGFFGLGIIVTLVFVASHAGGFLAKMAPLLWGQSSSVL